MRLRGEVAKKTTRTGPRGFPGRAAAVSRRGSTRNTVKTLEDRIEAPRLFAAVPPQMCRELGAELLAIHKLILPATSDQRGRPRGADSSAFSGAQGQSRSNLREFCDASLRWHKKCQYDDASVPHLKPQETPGRAASPQTRCGPSEVAVVAQWCVKGTQLTCPISA